MVIKVATNRIHLIFLKAIVSPGKFAAFFDYNSNMPQRIYHGKLTNNDLAKSIIAHFSRGNLLVQQFGSGDNLVVQLASSPYARSGGTTALSVLLQNVEDGVSVSLSKQAWFGIAASLGVSTIAALRNPFSLLNRLDDIAQDIEYVQLVDNVWSIIDKTARSMGSGFELSERLSRYICDYCNTANPPGEPSCIACGAPLGNIQPATCSNCGFIISKTEKVCPNCGKAVK
ncbi:MAG TPA: zinc ribbon domain-containing protein [Anaerolineaceae bacterium]|nr:zinc ribbon domain-containing protein [Anaerolineaceae bacterium]